jgi:hypothetical protein
MSLDHQGVKKMWFSVGSDKSRRARTGGAVPYTEFPLAEVMAELDGAVPVCLNHHQVISVAQTRKPGYKPQVMDYVSPDEPLPFADDWEQDYLW